MEAKTFTRGHELFPELLNILLERMEKSNVVVVSPETAIESITCTLDKDSKTLSIMYEPADDVNTYFENGILYVVGAKR